jgi:Topoisomerase DNA binding C4 zinc finger
MRTLLRRGDEPHEPVTSPPGGRSVSTIVSVVVWFGATLLVWIVGAAFTRGAHKIAFTLLVLSGGLTSGIILQPKSQVPEPLFLIYTILLIGAFALDISLTRSSYPQGKRRPSGVGGILFALVALVLVIGVGGYVLFELPRIIGDALVRNVSFLSGHSDLATVLAIGIVFGGIYLSVFVLGGVITAWERLKRCPHGVRGGAYRQTCAACAKPEPLRPAAAAVPHCPRCSAPMKLRSGRYGQFWGCTRYPRCKSTRSLR